MDVKQYFRRLREIEASLEEEFPVVVSTATPDGGRAGLVSEVTRLNAAKLIAEGRAVLATEQQRQTLQTEKVEALKAVQMAERAKQVHVTLVNDGELQAGERRPKSGR
jgi:hypothetical protein